MNIDPKGPEWVIRRGFARVWLRNCSGTRISRPNQA